MNSTSQVPEGYKQTEVGVIPDDWNVEVVKHAYDIRNNLRFPLSEKVRKEMQGEYPYYGPTKIQDYINEYRVEGEYCLIGEDGDHFLKWQRMPMTLFVKGRFNVNNHAHLVYGIKNETIWFYYFFSNRDITQHLTRQGAGRYKLTKASLESISLAIPQTKTEQTAIANALSDADAWIQPLTRLIAKKRQIKQGAMQDLLSPWEKVNNGEVKIESGEFKTAEPCSQLSTLNSQLKKGWVVKTLGDVADVIGGGTPSSFNSSFWNGDINWYTPTEIGENKYVYESKRKITAEGYSNSSANFLPIGTILLTSRAGIGDLGILMKEGCTNQGFQSLIAKESTGYEFLYYLMGTLKNQLLQNASGSTFLEISPGKLKQIEVVVPQKEEQENIATILSDMDKEITALETKLKKAQQIKQGMMQELLTGKTRLIKLKMED